MSQMKRFSIRAFSAFLAFLLISCQRTPDLHLHDPSHNADQPEVHLDINVLWNYDIGYDWQAEWSYGWDELDEATMGKLGYTEPKSFDLRRYYLGDIHDQPHHSVENFIVDGNVFRTHYHYGYYDLLTWNRIITPDMVQSIVFDETTSLDSVMVSTEVSKMTSRYQAPLYDHAFNQPEELFADYERDIHISKNMEDFEGYDEETQTYYKKMQMHLAPVTYIYLTQVRLHNNKSRVINTEGEANLSGMARQVTLNSGITGKDVVTVHYFTRFKKDCVIKDTGESVDIIGGRCLTFGVPNQNPNLVTKAEDLNDRVKHYMDVHMLFYNGMDSTMVFDVSEQVRKRYRGGVITIDLNVDTIPIPSRGGGSAFDAVVKEFDEENFYIDI